jgi:hypothetical protein
MIAQPSSSFDISVGRLRRGVLLLSFLGLSIRRAYDSAAFFVGRYFDYEAPQGSADVYNCRFEY